MVNYDREVVFNALADGVRRQILDLLSQRECSAGQIGGRFAISQPAISRHLRKLRNAGLVQSRTEAQRRIYRLNPEALREVDRWMEKYRVYWAARMRDLKSYVEGSP